MPLTYSEDVDPVWLFNKEKTEKAKTQTLSAARWLL